MRIHLEQQGPQLYLRFITNREQYRSSSRYRVSAVSVFLVSDSAHLPTDAPIVYHHYNKVAFDVGEPATIRCQMQAFPSPTFSWSRRGAQDSPDLSPLTNTSTSDLGNDVHQSELRLARVSEADYGEYVCQARNAEGERSTALRLQAKGRPEPPTEVHAAELGTSWALLDWTPGFDGGFRRTIHHVTLRDEEDKERAFDCQMRRPCNVTSLQHRTTYRVRVSRH